MILLTLNVIASEEEPDYSYIQGSKNLLAMKQDGRYKLYNDSTGKIVSDHLYNKIYGCYAYSDWENMVVVVQSGDRFGLIDAENGQVVLSPADSPITSFSDDFYAPEPLVWNIGGKKETLTSIPISLYAFEGYDNDLNPVIYYYRKGGDLNNPRTYMRIGFQDKEGKEIIPPLYDDRGGFTEDGLAIVVKNHKQGVISRILGKEIISCEYDWIEYNGEFLNIYNLEDTSQYAKREFWDRDVYDTKKDSFSDPPFKFSLYGLMDENRNEILPLKYEFIYYDRFGRYILRNSHQLVGMADNKGKIIVPIKYTDVHSDYTYSEYIIVELNGKCGIVTRRGKVLIRPDKFEAIRLEQAHNKLFFFAQAGGKWGRVNSKGKILTK